MKKIYFFLLLINISLAQNGMSVIDDARIVLRWDKNNFYSILEELDVDKNKPIKEINLPTNHNIY